MNLTFPVPPTNSHSCRTDSRYSKARTAAGAQARYKQLRYVDFSHVVRHMALALYAKDVQPAGDTHHATLAAAMMLGKRVTERHCMRLMVMERLLPIAEHEGHRLCVAAAAAVCCCVGQPGTHAVAAWHTVDARFMEKQRLLKLRDGVTIQAIKADDGVKQLMRSNRALLRLMFRVYANKVRRRTR